MTEVENDGSAEVGAALGGKDLAALMGLLADTVTVHHRGNAAPASGRDAARDLFAQVLEHCENLRHAAPSAGGRAGEWLFDADVDGRPVPGAVAVRIDGAGQITSLTAGMDLPLVEVAPGTPVAFPPLFVATGERLVSCPEAVIRSMTASARVLVTVFDDAARARACLPFAGQARYGWTYLPRPRPGVCLADLDRRARKAVHRLVATVLSAHTFAQVVTVMAFEEVLDRAEGWRRGRHSDDFWIVLFGEVGAESGWGWRFEGHHVSFTLTVIDGQLCPSPCFLGAHPAAVHHGGVAVVRPLAREEDLARTLLEVIGPVGRRRAIVADTAPRDIHSATTRQLPKVFAPVGIPASHLPAPAMAVLARLVGVYAHRLVPELAVCELAGVDLAATCFSWEGSARPGAGHAYRIQGPDLLIEYNNTAHGADHPHTVWRRPGRDFGDDLITGVRLAGGG